MKIRLYLLFLLATLLSCSNEPTPDCIEKPSTSDCPYIYQPVCGCNH